MTGVKKEIQKFKDKIEEKRPDNPVLWKPLFFVKDLGRFFLNKFKAKKYSGIIFQKEKGIWFNNPKVAGTSISSSFGRDVNNLDDIKEKDICKYKNYSKFFFVRNPYDKVVSCYTHLLKNKGGHKELFLKGMYFDFWRFHGKFWPEMSFREFIKSVHSISDKNASVPLKSQNYLISNKKGELITDFIGKFENLQEDFKKACKKIGIKNPPELPLINKSRSKKSYRDYYDEETKKLVYERYKKDFELFDYGF